MTTRSKLLAPLVLGILILVSACAPPATGGGTPTTAPPTTSTTTTIPSTYKNGRCNGSEGVTVVVDLVGFDNSVVVRCAVGPQATGRAALERAGFAHDPGNYPGTVCQLNGLPTQGHPYCWTSGGYWSYWKSTSAGAPWTFSEWGFTQGPAPQLGHVEGWRFWRFSDGQTALPPRVGTSGPVTP